MTVTVNSVSYTVGDGNLTYNNVAHTWSLTIPATNTLTDGTYDVKVTVTDRATNKSTDATTNEVVVNTTVATVPVVPPTNDTPPSITDTETEPAGGTDNHFQPANTVAVIETDTAANTFRYYLFSMTPPPPQEVVVEDITTFDLPPGTFQHTDISARLELEATLSDGRPLPDWLKFEPSNGSFIAQPPKGVSGVIDIKVTAHDEMGNSDSVNFSIHVYREKARKGDDRPSDGKESNKTGDDKPDNDSENIEGDASLTELPENQAAAKILNFNFAHLKGRPSLAEQIAAQGRNGMQIEMNRLLDCFQRMDGKKHVA